MLVLFMLNFGPSQGPCNGDRLDSLPKKQSSKRAGLITGTVSKAAGRRAGVSLFSPGRWPDRTYESEDSLHSYPFYINDWRTSEAVQSMTLEAQGLYRNLLDICWERGSLPTEPRALQILAMARDDEFERAWPAVAACFDLYEGRLYNRKVDDKRPAIVDAKAARNAGHAGPAARAIAGGRGRATSAQRDETGKFLPRGVGEKPATASVSQPEPSVEPSVAGPAWSSQPATNDRITVLPVKTAISKTSGGGLLSTEYPETAAAVRLRFPFTDSQKLNEIVQAVLATVPSANDSQMAEAVPIATRPKQQSAGLYRVTLPLVVSEARGRSENRVAARESGGEVESSGNIPPEFWEWSLANGIQTGDGGQLMAALTRWEREAVPIPPQMETANRELALAAGGAR